MTIYDLREVIVEESAHFRSYDRAIMSPRIVRSAQEIVVDIHLGGTRTTRSRSSAVRFGLAKARQIARQKGSVQVWVANKLRKVLG